MVKIILVSDVKVSVPANYIQTFGERCVSKVRKLQVNKIRL